MNKLVLIGNIKDTTGPSLVLKNLKRYMENIYQLYIIDTSSKDKRGKLKELLMVLKLLFQSNMTVNVHSFGFKLPYIICLISKINHKNTYYLTLHGITSIENEIEKRQERSNSTRIEKKVIKEFPNIVCVSNFEKRILNKRFNRKENVYVVENGYYIENKNINKKKDSEYCQFIMAGGFSRNKNTLEAIKLIEYLTTKEFKCKLTICGNINNEDYYNECVEYIKKHQLKQQINYLGKVDLKQLHCYYQDANYIVSFSKFDTFNLTVLEGMQNRNSSNYYYY